MSSHTDPSRRRSSQRNVRVIFHCPGCGKPLAPNSNWCEFCGFTGAKTLEIFSGMPPPPLPILDAVALWNPQDLKLIETAREAIVLRLPQFQWRICCVKLPPQTSLPLFGFWLLNASPLLENETVLQREWTVLLLLDVNSGQAAVVPGYSAEAWLSDEDWKRVIKHMVPHWQRGHTAAAVVEFFDQAQNFLNLAWQQNGSRKSI